MTAIDDIFETILHDSLHTYRRKHSNAPLPALSAARKHDRKHKKGAVAVVRQKEDLSTAHGVKGYVITSRETLREDAPALTHWTPNPYNYLEYSDKGKRHLKGHTEDNLQQINAFVVDIDTKQQPYTEILTACLDHSVGIPTLVLETPNGFQVYFVLESPLFISNRNDYRGLKVAKRISENVRQSLSQVLTGVDRSCNDFGFFRVPRAENVRWFNRDMRFSFHSLINWSKQQDDNAGRGLFVAPHAEQAVDVTTAPWFTELLQTRHVKGSSGQIGRDNLMYTIALAAYSAGKASEWTMDLLDEYNSAQNHPLRHSEVRKIVRSAYKGRFKGAHSAYVCDLLEAWLPGKDVVVTTHSGGWHKHKKARPDRVRSHYAEWEADVLSYIAAKTRPGAPVLWTTQRELCEAIGIPRSTFNELLRQSKQILVKREGKGRGAKTGLTSVAVLLSCALEFNQTHRAQYYAAVALMTGDPINQNALWELESRLSALTWKRPDAALLGKNFNSS